MSLVSILKSSRQNNSLEEISQKSPLMQEKKLHQGGFAMGDFTWFRVHGNAA